MTQTFTLSFTFNELMIAVCCFVLLLTATLFLRWLEKPLCPCLYGTLRCYRSEGHEGPHRTRDHFGPFSENIYWEGEDHPPRPRKDSP